MARALNRLTATFVKNCKASGRHADGGGLYLSVSPDGTRKRWTFLYKFAGKQREMGLGPASGAGAVSLSDARTRAEEARALVSSGLDPLAQKHGAAKDVAIPTFGQVAKEHIEAMSPRWRNPKHLDQWRMTLGDAYCGTITEKPVNEVAVADVLAILKPIWTTKSETASRLRGRIESVLDRATVAGHRSGDNPARWKGHLELMLPPIKKLAARGNHAAMPYQDVPVFIRKLRIIRGTGAWAFEFLVLTAARSGEVRGMTWGEVDFEGKVWSVPAERMKAKRDHRVPLSARAIEILHTVAALRRHEEGENGLVFPGQKRGKPLSDMAFALTLRRNGAEDFTPHGFRSSFRDWASEETDHPREIAEAALAHVVGDATERAYRRGDALEKRRKLMDDWANFIYLASQK